VISVPRSPAAPDVIVEIEVDVIVSVALGVAESRLDD